jgi:hypothetical protein
MLMASIVVAQHRQLLRLKRRPLRCPWRHHLLLVLRFPRKRLHRVRLERAPA